MFKALRALNIRSISKRVVGANETKSLSDSEDRGGVRGGAQGARAPHDFKNCHIKMQ